MREGEGLKRKNYRSVKKIVKVKKMLNKASIKTLYKKKQTINQRPLACVSSITTYLLFEKTDLRDRSIKF